MITVISHCFYWENAPIEAQQLK